MGGILVLLKFLALLALFKYFSCHEFARIPPSSAGASTSPLGQNNPLPVFDRTPPVGENLARRAGEVKKHRPIGRHFLIMIFFYNPFGVSIFTDDIFLSKALITSSVISKPFILAPVRAIRPSITKSRFFFAITPSIIGSRCFF